MRHLGELQASTGDAPLRVFLAENADWIWNANRNAQNQLGLSWSGAFDSADAARQSSALDALNAAIPFSAPEKNLALSRASTANGSCAAGQTAAQAFDGVVSTKWCAGATNGAYWLDVDLGAVVDVGRVIVRHASAGGENAACLVAADRSDDGRGAHLRAGGLRALRVRDRVVRRGRRAVRTDARRLRRSGAG